MLGLTLMWGYDLNLYTLAYLGGTGWGALFDWRGLFMAAVAPLFAASTAASKSLKIRLSRAATETLAVQAGLSGDLAHLPAGDGVTEATVGDGHTVRVKVERTSAG